MVYCSHCGQQISDEATACPSCGHPTGLATPGVTTVAPLASFGERFVGALIDGVVLAIAGGILRDRNGIGLVLGFLYHWLLLGLNDGRTLGKMVMGIRIARPDGSAIDLGTAAIRTLMSYVSGFALLIGYLWAAWDDENRTWHDIVADTRAFKQPR